MSETPGETDPVRSRPDGSAYKAHMDALTARNDAARKAGRAERKTREDAEERGRRETSARQDADLRQRSGHAAPKRTRSAG